jgi:FemAB-related protein (PEP-CTERM system-associated)
MPIDNDKSAARPVSVGRETDNHVAGVVIGMIEVVEQPDAALIGEVRQFLAAAPASTGVCGEHDPGWLAVLREGLGHRPMMVIARADGAGRPICGYLPLALVASRLFGRFLVSLPYLNRGGVVAADRDIAAALIDKAVELAGVHDAAYLELRHGGPIEHVALGARRDEKVRMVLDLPTDGKALWNGLDAKVRNQVRKGDKNQLSVRWGGEELLGDFYRVFAVNMRDLGTPVYSRRLFGAILAQMGERAELAVTDYQGRPVAGALLVHDPATAAGPGETRVPSASSLRDFSHTCANMWMYYQLLLRAVGRGSARFDFGRSSEGSGTYQFKRQWGAQAQATVRQYHVRRGDIQAMRPDSPGNRRRIAVWQRLPVWLTRLVGPSIVRGIP